MTLFSAVFCSFWVVGHAQWPGHGLVHFSDMSLAEIKNIIYRSEDEIYLIERRPLDEDESSSSLVFIIVPCPAGPKRDDSQLERVYELKLTLVARMRSLYYIIIIEVKTSGVGRYTAFQENNRILRSAEWRDWRTFY